MGRCSGSYAPGFAYIPALPVRQNIIPCGCCSRSLARLPATALPDWVPQPCRIGGHNLAGLVATAYPDWVPQPSRIGCHSLAGLRATALPDCVPQPCRIGDRSLAGLVAAALPDWGLFQARVVAMILRVSIRFRPFVFGNESLQLASGGYSALNVTIPDGCIGPNIVECGADRIRVDPHHA